MKSAYFQVYSWKAGILLEAPSHCIAGDISTHLTFPPSLEMGRAEAQNYKRAPL